MLQTLTMWSQNKTLEWFEGKSNEEKRDIMERARKNVGKMKEKYDERRAKLVDDRKNRLLEKQKEKAKAEEKLIMKKAEAVNSLVDLNVRAWMSTEDLELNLVKVEEKDRCKVLLAQLNLYKNVVPFKCDNKLYVKTKVENKKRVDLTWQELKENLCKVISVCYSSTPEKIAKPHLKVSDERDEAVVAHKEQLMKKIKTHTLKLHTDKQKEEMLPKFIENPETFIGVQIQHLWKEEADEDAVRALDSRTNIGQIKTGHCHPPRRKEHPGSAFAAPHAWPWRSN